MIAFLRRYLPSVLRGATAHNIVAPLRKMTDELDLHVDRSRTTLEALSVRAAAIAERSQRILADIQTARTFRFRLGNLIDTSDANS